MSSPATPKPAEAETAQETIDRMVKEPTLDALFRKNPKRLTDDELRAYVEEQRRRRAAFHDKRT